MTTPTRPNVVLVTCHDLGRHIACYGTPSVRTPNFDAVAAAGVRLKDVFCVAPQCSPSRATLYTGRYPHCNGVMGLAHAGFGWELNPGERHLANVLGEAGWVTALAGLQHETSDPQRMEYDEIVLSEAPECVHVAKNAAAFIHEHAGGDAPFYLQVGFLEPHRPFEMFNTPPDDEDGVFIPPYIVGDDGARDEFALFQGAVRKVDVAIGTVVEALEAAGVRDDTLLILTTDHGIPFPRAKCSLFDPGIEVFAIFDWPKAGWPQGAVVDGLVSNVDFLPTILDLCGVTAPDNVQGTSFADALAGEPFAGRDELYAELTYHNYYDPRRAIRTATHKLIVNFSNAPFFMDPSQTWRPGTTARHPAGAAVSYVFHPPVELYDLRADPLEEKNLANDPASAAVSADLIGRLSRWMKETEDPLLHGVPVSPMHRRAMEILGLE